MGVAMPRNISDFGFADRLMTRFNILEPYIHEVPSTPPGALTSIHTLVLRIPIGIILDQIMERLTNTGICKSNRKSIIDCIRPFGFEAMTGNHSRYCKERQYQLPNTTIPITKDAYKLYLLPNIDRLFVNRRIKNPILSLLEDPEISQSLWVHYRNSYHFQQITQQTIHPGSPQVSTSSLNPQRQSPTQHNNPSPIHCLYNELSEYFYLGVPPSPSPTQRSSTPQASTTGWNYPLITNLITRRPPLHLNQPSPPVGGPMRHQQQDSRHRPYNHLAAQAHITNRSRTPDGLPDDWLDES